MAATAIARPRVFLELSAGTEPLGRVTIELSTDQAPKTCENFRVLCAGTRPPLTYKTSRFHRIVDEFMLQGGDITKGDGTGGESIYGGEFEDENLGWREIDKEGLVCMANRGKATNSSQFFITLAPADHLNGKHTVFGRVVTGYPILEQLAKVQVDKDDRPVVDVIISRCGELERRKADTNAKPKEEVKARTEEKQSHRRGREKGARSPHSMSSRSRSSNNQSPSPRRRRRSSSKTRPQDTAGTRRRSDHAMDEGIRGREQRTSHSYHAQDKSSYQAVRKRSPSPSRAVQRDRSRSRSPGGFRRRKSLPNHYERREDQSRHQRDDQRVRTEGRRREDGDWYRGAFGGERGPRRDDRRDGRLDSGGGGDSEPEIIFKGRGAMKYRETKGY